jgi:neopullulanase
MLAIYDWEINLAQLNLIDSHDTARTLWMVGGDESALRLCTLFQMTMPGAPCIYYGDEIGMTGGHEPASRAAFPWDEEESWDHDLHDFYKNAIAMRHQHPALRTGDFKTLHARGNIYAFGRTLGAEEMIVIFNIGVRTSTFDLKLPDTTREAASFDAVWGQGSYVAEQGNLLGVSVPGRSALVLKRKEAN